MVGRAQVVLTSDDTVSHFQIDYSNPVTFEIGGITTSGTGNLDQRMLLFQVGDEIEIPGEKISKTIKKLWSTGLYENIRPYILQVKHSQFRQCLDEVPASCSYL